MRDALFVARAEIVGNDRHHTVVEAEDRHEEEALQLEVNAENGSRRRREHQQDLVHSESHDRTDRHHQNRRDADYVDGFDGLCIEAHFFERQVDIRIFARIVENAEDHRDDLSEDGRDSCSGNAHLRETEQTENQDRIEDDVEDRAESLRDHIVKGQSGRLQQPLHVDLHEYAERADADDGHILCPVLKNLRITCLCGEERARAENTDQGEHEITAKCEQDTVVGSPVCLLVILFAETSGEQCVDADACTGGNRNHQILNRESERHGCQGIFVDLRYEHAVNDIVQRLHKH